ncbi:hypothetical protein DdX_17929 [Ditylenchus destructor]|uniref:G domain-containing protein n=1 Tax=Ditylenchus destructor TaxID=166010 RepID=A0AAD4MLP2_9BILA|nr:hypothetical protein DdX_17929 [Ditylenchus destructor]
MDFRKSAYDALSVFLEGIIRRKCDRDNTLNILILGETAVGKSTWINAIANYLEYGSLDTAQLSNDPKWKIPLRFTISDDHLNEQTIFVGSEGTKVGESSGTFPQPYEFMWGNRKVRFIDTPGIGDSHGLPQNKIHLGNIFRYIEEHQIRNLSAIIILMKPNEKVFTPAFMYCISELFTHLPKRCAENVLFGFTGTRPFHYQIAATLTPLRQFLATLKERQNVSLEVSKDTAFCFDNEAFRFLFAALPANGITFTDDARKNYAASWGQSVKETLRFLDRVSSLSPLGTTDMISLNEARQYISVLTKPLALISDMIEIVNEEIERLLIETRDKQLALEMVVERLQATLEEYKAEKEMMGDIAAMFGAFLKKTAIMPFNDAVEKYIKLSIQQAEYMAEITRIPADIEHVKTLRDWLERYKQQKQYIEIGAEDGCTASEVKGYFQKLLNLKHCGRYIKEMFDCEKMGMEDQKKHTSSGAQSHSAGNQPSFFHGIKSWISRITG